MVKINYEYRGGVLFVRIEGRFSYQNVEQIIDSIRRVVVKGGIIYTVINLERAKVLNDNYIEMLLKDINDNVYLCGCNSDHYNNYHLLNTENNIFKCIGGI